MTRSPRTRLQASIPQPRPWTAALAALLTLACFALAGLPAAAQSCISPPSGLVSWWSGDLCWPEDIRGPNNGFYTGFPVCSIYWKVGGGALSFDQDNPDYVTVPHDVSLDFGTGSFSLDAWIRTADADGTLVAKGEPGDPGFVWFLDSGRLGFAMCTSDLCTVPLYSSGFVDDENWHLVAVTVDRQLPGGTDTTITLYIDGVADGSLNVTLTGSPDSSEPLIMGANAPFLGADFFDGQIDELELFNRTLTASEVADLFDADSDGKCRENCATPPNDMVLWLPFNETSGTISNDIVQNLDGTQINGPTPDAGRVGGSLRFDGTDDRVDVPDDPSFDFSGGRFSVDFWIHPDLDEDRGTVVKKGQTGASPLNLITQGFHIYYNHGHFLGHFVSTTGAYINDLSPTFTHHAWPEVWTFVVITVDIPARRIHLYVDGELAQITPIPSYLSTDLTNAEPLQIAGQSIAGTDRAFDGRLDELEFFDRVLTSAEVLELYEAGSAGKCTDDIGLPWDKPFCSGQKSVNVSTQVCNQSAQPQTYELNMAPLPASTPGCTIDGPTDFTYLGPPAQSLPPAVTITVPAGTCISVPIRIRRPTDMNGVYQIGCYEATLRNTSTGLVQRTHGSVQDRRDLCAVIGDPWTDGVLPFSEDLAEGVRFEVTNTTQESRQIDFTITAYSVGMEDLSSSLQLGGQEPGTPVVGTILLSPGETTEIPLEIQAVGSLPFGFQDIVLYTSSEESQESEVPLTSITVYREPGHTGEENQEGDKPRGESRQ